MGLNWNFLADGRTGPIYAEDGSATYTVPIEVITDEYMTGLQVVSWDGFPRQYVTPHPEDPQARATQITKMERDDGNAFYWYVTYAFSTKIPNFAQGKADGSHQTDPKHESNPLDRKPKVSYSTQKHKKLLVKDLDGESITNAAGIPYETMTVETNRLHVHVTRNLYQFPLSLINDCDGFVNAAEVNMQGKLCAPRQLKCEHVKADAKWDKEQFYWEVSAEFIIGRSADIIVPHPPPVPPDTTIIPEDRYFYEWKLNAGLDIWNVLLEDYQPIILPGGQKPSRPLPLNDDGTDWLERDNTDDITWFAFRVIPDADLTLLCHLLFD